MIKREAKYKIHNHISRYGKLKNFKISTRMMKHWWNVLNVAVFDNCLSAPNFEIKILRGGDGRGTYGECTGLYSFDKDGKRVLSVIIRLNHEMIFTREHFIAVLVHEMVHAWQFEYREEVMHDKRMSHGPTFTQWRDEIEDIVGVKLETYMDEDDVLASWITK